MAISRSARITLLLFIDVIFFLVELIVGYAVGSLALVADSFHMLNDIMSLVVALYAIKLTANQTPDTRYSYGWHRAEILAALVNGVFLLALCFSIFMEALERFFSTPEISNPRLVVIVGSLGLASNIVGLFLFQEHGHSHSHGGAKHHKKLDHADHDGHSDGTDSGAVTPRPDDAMTRRRSDSLYGHPVATRAYVVQAAQDLQHARSPSPPRAASPLSLRKQESIQSVLNNEIPVEEEEIGSGSVADHSESTPLLRGDSHQHKLSEPASLSGGSPHSHAEQKLKASPGHGHSHGAGSMNMQALVLHVMGDALGNVGVIATGLVIWLTTWSGRFYFDPIISLVITVIIFSSALPLVKSASFILLQGVPPGISLEDVDNAIRKVQGVQDVHELHVWQLSESRIVASVHVLLSKGGDFMQVASDVKRVVHEYGIHSITTQPEYHTDYSRLPETTSVVSNGASCLVPCPPDQECDPAERACCPPPSADV